jgi:hypothetical protein
MNSRTFSKCIDEGYYLASNDKMITWGNDSIKIFPTKKLALKFLIDEREWFKKQGLTPEDFEIKLCWVVAEKDCINDI